MINDSDNTVTIGKFAERPHIRSETFVYTLDDHPGIEYEWDVVRAQQFVNELPLGSFSLEDTDDLWAMLQAGKAEADPERARDANLYLPLICVPLPFPLTEDGQHQHVVIDGWHRVYRAHQEGCPEVLLAILSEEQERAIRLRPTDDQLREPSHA